MNLGDDKWKERMMDLLKYKILHREYFHNIGKNIRIYSWINERKNRISFGRCIVVSEKVTVVKYGISTTITYDYVDLNNVIFHLHTVIVPKINHKMKMHHTFNIIHALPGGIDYQNAKTSFELKQK